MSGKLGWTGAYNRPRTLGPITPNRIDEERSSAGHSNAEREIKFLRAENMKLKKDYDELNLALKQVVGESSHEKFDERRINLLKLQIIQLERQVFVLNEALGCRHEAMLEVENTMAWLADKLRSFISAEVKGSLVPIARADLMTLVENSESARIKLFKTIEGSQKERFGKDLLLLNPFLGGKYAKGDQLSLLDISLDRMSYINLKHVAQLESKLCVLYKDLIRVFEQLESVARTPAHVGQEGSAEWNRLKTSLLKTCVTGKDAADDLLALSLLCPSSPWPALKRPLTKQVPVDRVTAALPAVMPRQKQEEITHIIEASIGVCNHRHLLLEKEKAVLKEELVFHRATHDLQVQYTKSIFEAVRKGYGEFENSAKATIVKPIKNMLDAYRQLKGSISEQALRDFLVIIKENEEQLSSIVEMFEKQNFERDETGGAAFTTFGSEFFSKMDSLVEQCQKARDKAVEQRKDVAEVQRQKDLELQQLIEDLEAKYEKQWNPVNTHTRSKETKVVGNVEIISTLQGVDLGGRKDKDSGSARSLDSKVLKDDPTVLRSYLYSDSAESFDKPSNEACSTPTSTRTNDAQDMADTNQLSGIERKRQVKKGTKWKPDQEWVHDFSGLTDRSDSTLADSSHLTNKSKKVKNKKPKEWDNNFTQPPTNSEDGEKSDHAIESPVVCSDVHSLTGAEDSSLTSGVVAKVKKPPRSYEPRLYVANRTLNLRRAGSISSLTAGEKTDREVKVEGSDVSPPLPAEEVLKPAVSENVRQKPATFHKRSSWR